jgi:hypothetical protein
VSIARRNLKGPEEKYRAVVNGDTQRRTGQPRVGKVEPVIWGEGVLIHPHLFTKSSQIF